MIHKILASLRKDVWFGKLLIFASILMLFSGSGCAKEKPAAPNLKIGLLEEPKTLNVWLASDAAAHLNGQCLSCNGRKTEHTVQLADSKLARVHIIVWLKPGSAPRIAIGSLEKRIAEAVRTWEDNLRDALIDHCGEETGLKLYRRFGECFPAAAVGPIVVDERSPPGQRASAWSRPTVSTHHRTGASAWSPYRA